MEATRHTNDMDLSVVIPAHNEAESLPELVRRLVAVLSTLPQRWELLIVDDGSSDGSPELLSRLATDEPRLRPYALRRRRGQTAALHAGLRRARGNVLVTLDADLQNFPEDIPLLLAALDDGADVVSGWREGRRDGWLRAAPSRMANALIHRLTRVPVRDHGCALKAYRRETLDGLHLYADHHRLLAVLCVLQGARVREIPVRHAPRLAGQSKYGLRRTFRVLADVLALTMLLYHRRRPSSWFLLLALPMAFAASMALLASGLEWFGGAGRPGVVWLGSAFILGMGAFALGGMALFSEFLLRLEPFPLKPAVEDRR